ncbi:MAG: CHAT domain-containing protein [Calothrix sp. MO_192.B10]|nr:CHAT domain-containing protein [Calothrix sp. MO_192.B10]
MELNLRFPEIDRVIVKLDDQETDRLDFTNPLSTADLEEIRWYLEVYSSRYTTEVDDKRAQQIQQKLPQWGEDLFDAVFNHRPAQRIFNQFQDADEETRLLTISASHPAILSLPWELLRDSAGTYLVHDNPRISIRRRLAGAGGGRRPFKIKQKDCLRLLFVISRPTDAGFIDPRGEARAVLDAIEQEAAGRVEVEFLRPATLDNLVERLEDKRKPPIDIVHFDGHGVYDADGSLQEKAKLSDPVAATKGENGNGGNTGYLLFEDKEGKTALITAETLGDMLNRQKVGLIVLSACQSAAVAGEDAMGCVAARLTHAGIPTVLAMTYSVLVTTAHQLFAKFYQRLMRGEGMGEALDNARRDLYLNRERGERQRGEKRITLKLDDWFLPALYQAAGDTPLLTDTFPLSPTPPLSPSSNLPQLQEAGFFGRNREIWQIERAFVQQTRRITISGFGGQGKTYLACEAGRWLCRTGVFEQVCFVDYAAFQGVDAVGLAVSTLGTVLDRSFVDVEAVRAYLQGEKQSLLLILDNLETISPQPLQELLTVAKQWSEVGNCRVLLTTRTPDFAHADYSREGSLKHISLPLQGLGEEDALDYFQTLMKLPPEPQFDLPKRQALLKLFKLVDFHPLSIKLLAWQLKYRRIAEIGQRLEQLIAATTNVPDKDRSLLASLNLSLERLEGEAQQWLPKLGVFQGGALEMLLLAITELSESQWQILRPALENTGLMQAEYLPGVNSSFLKFHPTLAPVLWLRLSAEEQGELLARHRQRYALLSNYLYEQDIPNPVFARAIAQRELPNLLMAVHGALEADEEWAVHFVNNVSRFLNNFGLNRDRAVLIAKLGKKDDFLARSNRGEKLYSDGHYGEAAQVFGEILAGLGESPSYDRCLTLGRLGRCFREQGQAAQAATLYRQALVELGQLDSSDEVKRQMGAMQTDLGDVLTDMGDYEEARKAYEAALAISREQDNDHQIAVVQGQLGTLALVQSNLPEAEKRYREALKTFQRLDEPASEAVLWHQLGRVYEEAHQWDAAEETYREAARIDEFQGNLAGAARTWNQLAMVNMYAGRPEAAEAWYKKAGDEFKALGDKATASKVLSNLANLLQNQRNSQGQYHRLTEARQYGEEALAILKNLDPDATEIWITYTILAKIADKQGEAAPAREYRLLARRAKAAFAGTQYELRQYGQFIAWVVAAVGDAQVRQQLESDMQEVGNNNRVAAIRRILDGERDEEALVEPLDFEDSMIVSAILQGIADPQTLKPLLREGE